MNQKRNKTGPAKMTAVFLLAGALSCTLDLRPGKLKEAPPAPENTAQANRTLAGLFSAHGGAGWQKYRTTSVWLRNSWDSLLGQWAGFAVWDNNDKIRLHFKNRYPSIAATHETGKFKGYRYGIEGDRVFTEFNGRKTGELEGKAAFILRTWAWLLQLPFRAKDNTSHLAMLPPGEFNGRSYTRVFMTWHSFEANLDADQYILWIDKETGRLKLAEYTVREQFRGIRGTAYFDDYRRKDGVLVPGKMTITQELTGDYNTNYVQQMTIDRLEFDRPDAPAAAVSP